MGICVIIKANLIISFKFNLFIIARLKHLKYLTCSFYDEEKTNFRTKLKLSIKR